MPQGGKKAGFARRLGNAWDGAIGIFSPVKAAKNRRIRALEDFSGHTKYDGAVIGAFENYWRAGAETADDALLPELAILRQRSRDLYRNNPLASSILNALVTNVIGTGLRPQSRIDWQTLGVPKERAGEIQRMAEANFRDHARCIDYEDRLNYWQMQRLQYRQFLESGEFLKLRRYVDPVERKWARYGTCWQLVEPDCLMTPPDMADNPNIRGGVELGKRGEPVAYWIAKYHPGDSRALFRYSKNDFTKIPAFDEEGRPLVVHRYLKLRPGQTRGVPLFAAIIETLGNVKQAFSNELISELASSCLSYYIQTETAWADADAATERTITSPGLNGDTVQQIERAFPGMIMRLPPGETVNAFMPNRPAPTFKDYLMFGMRWAGAAAGIPYEVFTGDWSNTTYTSGRMSVLNFQQGVDIHQQDFIEGDCQPTWEMSFEEQMWRGDLPNLRDWRRRKTSWCRTQWITPARPWVDPLKDVTAKGLAMDRGLTTRAYECASLGLDWEEVEDQLQEERMKALEHRGELQKRADELGLLPDPADASNPGAGDLSERQAKETQARALRLIETEAAHG